MTYTKVLALVLSLDTAEKARLLCELSKAVMNDAERAQRQIDHIKACNRIAAKITKDKSVRDVLEE